MNPLVLFLPNFKASTTAYLLGLVILAAADYARLQFGIPFIPGWIGMIAIWFFVFSLHANRRRAVEQGIGLAFLPVTLAIVAKGIGAVVGFFPGLMDTMTQFAEESGVDTSDSAALQEAFNDPGFQQSYQAWLEANPEVIASFLSGTAIPSFIGFWLVIAVFAIWFAQMKRTGGSINNDAPGTGEADGGSGETD